MKVKLLLLPLAWLFGLIVYLRYKLYHLGIFKRHQFDVPIIVVGNLSVGGTGKSPLTQYITTLLSKYKTTGVLSRGYGRKSKGLQFANSKTNASLLGDEPMMYYQHFSNSAKVIVAVAEKRVLGINALIAKGVEAIVLDDAYQHLSVKAGLNILLTEYKQPYSSDFLLPAGRLRDCRLAAQRAQVIMVTKCPSNLSVNDKKKITESLKPLPQQQLFFSAVVYAPIKAVLNPLNALAQNATDLQNYDCVLITGIAKPHELVNYCQQNFAHVHTLTFADHHVFKTNELIECRKIFDNIANSKKLILTTQKDWMRLQQGYLKVVLNDLPVYVQPIAIEIDNQIDFNQTILNYVNCIETNC
jgi:tetraacyldisaccharide 4'-kinase